MGFCDNHCIFLFIFYFFLHSNQTTSDRHFPLIGKVRVNSCQFWLFAKQVYNAMQCGSAMHYFWIKYDLGQKNYVPQVRPDKGSTSCPPDHDSTFHVTETPALTTLPSETSTSIIDCHTNAIVCHGNHQEFHKNNFLSSIPIVTQEHSHSVTMCPSTTSSCNNAHPPKVIVSAQYVMITCYDVMLYDP